MPSSRPIPTHLKLLAGNPGRRPLNAKEPKPKGDLFAVPDELTESQRRIWSTAIADAPVGLLKRLDAAIFRVWVCAFDAHTQAADAVAKHGLMVKSPQKGVPMQNPYLAVMNRQALILMKASAEMGFTPSARSRVQCTPDDDDEESPASRYQL